MERTCAAEENDECSAAVARLCWCAGEVRWSGSGAPRRRCRWRTAAATTHACMAAMLRCVEWSKRPACMPNHRSHATTAKSTIPRTSADSKRQLRHSRPRGRSLCSLLGMHARWPLQQVVQSSAEAASCYTNRIPRAAELGLLYRVRGAVFRPQVTCKMQQLLGALHSRGLTYRMTTGSSGSRASR
jgi:hypothetical protein